MQAKELKLDDFLSSNKTRFVIPVYQRNYDWTTKECEQLFNDILEIGKDDSVNAHFIGSIVYVHDGIYTTSGLKELIIIDGQQRLTTITLIYMAIYKLALENNNKNLADEIYETYLTNKFASDNEKLKLKPTDNNDRAFQFVIKNHQGQQYPEYSRIVDNYQFFRGRITQDKYQNILIGLRKLIFVEISLDRENDNPQRIFESLNSTGLELSQADLIRNYILMGLEHKEQTRIYDNYWADIENYAKDESTNQSRVSDFIRDYLTIKNQKIPNKKNVYLEFKNKYHQDSLENLEKALTEMRQLVVHYNKLVNPSNENDEKIREQLNYINRLEINVAFPFLLPVFNDYVTNKIDKKIFVQVLELVQSFTWRRFVVGVPTNALNKIFMNLYEKVTYDNYLESIQAALVQRGGTQRFPNDSEVLNALQTKDMYNIQSKNRLYILERLEHHNNNERIQIDGNSKITTEHIFPQKPDIAWRQKISSEDFQQLKDVYLHTLANLTLSGNNGKLGNKWFIEKRDMPDGGYKSSSLWLNRHLANLDTWDVFELNKRHEAIKSRFLEIWPYPDLKIDNASTEDEVNIFDADEPRNKTLEYAIFLDEKKVFKSVTELYIYVLKSLFEMQPETFYSSDLSDRIDLVKGKDASEQLRQPKQIADNYYVETNLDSNGKFERIKHALTVFELEDELSIKYES